MAGMGQKGGGYSGAGRDAVTSPSESGGSGHNFLTDPSGDAGGEGCDMLLEPGGKGQKAPTQATGSGYQNKESVPEGGMLPFPALDKHLMKNQKSAPGGTVPSQAMPPVPTQTSASPAGGAGHKPWRFSSK